MESTIRRLGDYQANVDLPQAVEHEAAQQLQLLVVHLKTAGVIKLEVVKEEYLGENFFGWVSIVAQKGPRLLEVFRYISKCLLIIIVFSF